MSEAGERVAHHDIWATILSSSDNPKKKRNAANLIYYQKLVLV